MTASDKVVPSVYNLDGFLSNDCMVNSLFCEANVFYVHYCSSDLWAGDTMQHFDGRDFQFRGKAIV